MSRKFRMKLSHLLRSSERADRKSSHAKAGVVPKPQPVRCLERLNGGAHLGERDCLFGRHAPGTSPVLRRRQEFPPQSAYAAFPRPLDIIAP